MKDELINKYIKFRSDANNDGLPDDHFCQEYGISAGELTEIKEKNPAIAKQCLEARRTRYSEKIQKIDDALFAAASSGDTRAAELIYRRFDSYDPKNKTEETGVTTFVDLVKSIHKRQII